jgi:hypothetical protein
MPEWMRDLVRNVDDKLVADIVSDFRRGPPPPGPTLPTANPVDAAPVVTGSDRVTGGGSGWANSPEIKDWRPPGVDICDRLMDQQDAIDRAERIRQLAGAAVVQRAEAEIKQQEAELKHKEKGKE